MTTSNKSQDIKISIQEKNEGTFSSILTKFDNSKPPHNGKEISSIIFSPDLSYLVTFSSEDSSIVGWPVKEDEFGELTYDTECKSENIMQILQVSNHKHVLIEVLEPTIFQKTSYKIIELNPIGNNIYFVKGNPRIDKGTFVAGTNDLFMIYGIEAMAHLYSNSTGEWKIKEIFGFELSKGNYSDLKLGYFMTPEKLFLANGGCNVLSQWDLATMTFEKQYLLDVKLDNLHPSTAIDIRLQNNPIEIEQKIIINDSKTLMAIYGFSTLNVEHQIAIYSTQSCIRIASAVMDYGAYSVLRFNFLKTDEFDEDLLIRESGIFFVEPSYHLVDYNNRNAEVNIEQLFVHQPDNSSVEVILGNGRIVCCSQGKIIHYGIDKKHLEKSQEKLKLHSCSRASRVHFLKIVNDLLKKIQSRKYSFTQKTFALSRINVRWKVLHYSGTGSTHIIAYKGKKMIDEYKFFEPRTGYVYDCRPTNNGDLIMITKRGIKIFTFHTKDEKIQMCYFWVNDDWNNLWKETRHLTSDIFLNENDDDPFFGEKAVKELSEMKTLPPLDIERVLDEYETCCVSDHERRFIFKELLANYLSDVVILAELGESVLKLAIKKNKGNVVDLVYDSVMDNIRKDSGAYMGLLSIITSSLSQLQEHYPEVVKSYMSHTSLILDHDCVEITESKMPPFFGFARDQQILRDGVFNNIYSKFQTLSHVMSPLLLFKKKTHEIQNYGKPAVTLVVPLPKFASYNTNYKFLQDFIRPESNGFIEQEYYDLYKRWSGEALLHFKWHTFGKYYYYANWAVFTTFLIIFAFTSTLSEDNLPENNRKSLFIVAILFGSFQLSIEIRRIIWRPGYYFKDLWNLLDLCACCFPIATSIYWIQFGKPPEWLIASSNLLLDFEFLLYLRIFESYGRYSAIILGVAYRVFSFLVILFIILISFAHAFYIVLKPQKSFSLDTPSNNDLNDPNNPWSLTDVFYNYEENADGTLSQNVKPTYMKQPDGNTNMFALPHTALLAMYKLLSGDTSPLETWAYGDTPFVAILAVSFSFITVVYLMNLFIGLLSNVIEDYNDRVSYLVQKAKILGEIELFHLFPQQRRWRTWFPDWIYYEVPVDYVRKKVRNIDANEDDSEFPPVVRLKLRNLIDLQKPTDEKDLSNQIKVIQNFLEKQFKEFKQ